jgi:hypothetical protein
MDFGAPYTPEETSVKEKGMEIRPLKRNYKLTSFIFRRPVEQSNNIGCIQSTILIDTIGLTNLPFSAH